MAGPAEPRATPTHDVRLCIELNNAYSHTIWFTDFWSTCNKKVKELTFYTRGPKGLSADTECCNPRTASKRSTLDLLI